MHRASLSRSQRGILVRVQRSFSPFSHHEELFWPRQRRETIRPRISRAREIDYAILRITLAWFIPLMGVRAFISRPCEAIPRGFVGWRCPSCRWQENSRWVIQRSVRRRLPTTTIMPTYLGYTHLPNAISIVGDHNPKVRSRAEWNRVEIRRRDARHDVPTLASPILSFVRKFKSIRHTLKYNRISKKKYK